MAMYCYIVPLRSRTTSYRDFQNKLGRVVCNVTTCQQHTVDRLCYLHWLPIRSRIMFRVAILCYNAYQLNQLNYLHATLEPYVPYHGIRSVEMNLLTIPRLCTKRVACRFSSAMSTVWNRPPLAIHNSSTAELIVHARHEWPINRLN